jgi:hypothetical protein
MDDPLGDGILRFIRRAVRLMRVLLALVGGDVFELVCFLLEKLINFLLIFDDSLRNNLPMLDQRALTRLSR